MKKSAFTLAEVLITLSIIGVISVLTLPSFVDNYSGKANLTTLKATYQQVGDALSQAMIDQGVRNVADLEFTGDDNSEKLAFFVSKYLDVAKDCGNQPGTCFSPSYSTYTGKSVNTPFVNNGVAFSEYAKLTSEIISTILLLVSSGRHSSLHLFPASI